MSKKNERQSAESTLMKVQFSIRAKLVAIISIIVLMSLGSITALVSWLVREDLRIAAEENNFEANRRSAAEAEMVFSNVRSNSRSLLRTVTAVGTDSALAQESVEFFFEQNPDVAFIFFTFGVRPVEFFLNNRFFAGKGIDASLADSYRDNNIAALRQAAVGETALLNAAPHFNVSLLALFFPWQNGGGGVLFSPESLNESYSFGINQSYLLNNQDDILVHADHELVRAGTNAADMDFIRKIREAPERNKQEILNADFRFGLEETYTVKRSFFREHWENLKPKLITLKENVRPVIETALDAVFNLLRIERNIAGQDVKAQDDARSEGERYYVAFTKLNIAGAVVITSVEYEKVFEGIAATTRRNIYLTAAVLSISIILIWFFSKSISIPLKALAAAAHTIEGGSFELELRPKGRDEITVLTFSFQRMCKALGIFGRFTNRDIAVRAMRGEIRPGGLPKHATIFFSDIREFTSISERFTKTFGKGASDRIVFWLNNYLTSMVDCVEKTGGAVDKFIGDAVMAHWGTAYTAGSPRKDAFNCVKAALLMRKALYVMNKKRRPGDRGNPSIRIGCGINTGIVTAGQIGSDVRMEYTVIGDPVNLASRTEALTKPLGADILITENTWRLVRDDFITEEMPSVTVKGKAKPVRIFAVVNFTKSAKGPRTLADVRRLLRIKETDVSTVDVNADEKKYAIGGKK